MWTSSVDDQGICQRSRSVHTAKGIDVVFAVETDLQTLNRGEDFRGSRNIELDRDLVPHGEGRRFDVVFAKLLWLLVYNSPTCHVKLFL